MVEPRPCRGVGPFSWIPNTHTLPEGLPYGQVPSKDINRRTNVNMCFEWIQLIQLTLPQRSRHPGRDKQTGAGVRANSPTALHNACTRGKRGGTHSRVEVLTACYATVYFLSNCSRPPPPSKFSLFLDIICTPA